MDEVQDNLLIDTLCESLWLFCEACASRAMCHTVLRWLCKNPRGLFWAGDTAQTISPGSAFRFNDLKSFLHRAEVQYTSQCNAFSDDFQEKRALDLKTRAPHPKSFQLIVNYRSHGGIINCAQTVISLLTEFWPHSIDNLAPEEGSFGPRPVWFSGWDNDTLRYEQFLFGDV